MSAKIFALVFAVVIGVSHTLPAFDSDDVELLNPRRSGGRPDFRDPFEVPSFGDGFPFRFPDLSGIQDYIKQVRETIAATLSGASQGVDLSKGNTTSEVKIIDGNRVTINRTEYNENGVHVVVKNVDVQPVGDGSDATNTPAGTLGTTAAPPRGNREDIETFGDSANELGKYDNLETFDEVDNFQPHSSNSDIETFDKYPFDLSNDISVNKMAKRQYNEDVEEFDVNAINSISDQQNGRKHSQALKQMHYTHANEDYLQRQREFEDVEEVFHDLSGDTYVNDLLARKMAAADVNGKARPEAYEVFTHDNIANFRDLSRDTYVNELAARRGMPKNPDAEEFDTDVFYPNAFGHSNNALKKRQA